MPSSRFRLKFSAAIAWFAGVGLLVALSWFYQGETSTFNGVAEASETLISTETAAEVVTLSVHPGKQVKPGDTLAVLRSPELDLRITQLTRELEGVTGKSVASTTDNGRRVSEIRAAHETRKNQLQFEIQRLLEERSRNLELTSKLRSLPSVAPQDSNDALMLQVRAYQRELAMAESSARDQIALLEGSIGLQRSSGRAEQDAMRRELELLQHEKERLVIRAQSPALVGSVRAHVGEKVSPFDSILTLTPFSPTFVRGYIHEKVYNRIKENDFVIVRSSGERRGSVRGQVVGVGSRIVEFPIHLRKMPDILIWGREITIRIPAENSFLLGELVSISPESVVGAMISGRVE